MMAQYHSAKRRSRGKAREEDEETEGTSEEEEAMVQETRAPEQRSLEATAVAPRSEPSVYDIARANPAWPSSEVARLAELIGAKAASRQMERRRRVKAAATELERARERQEAEDIEIGGKTAIWLRNDRYAYGITSSEPEHENHFRVLLCGGRGCTFE